jgi:hypothetical protein
MVVDKRHAYEACEKKIIQKRVEMRENWMVKICMSDVSFLKALHFILFGANKKFGKLKRLFIAPTLVPKLVTTSSN